MIPNLATLGPSVPPFLSTQSFNPLFGRLRKPLRTQGKVSEMAVKGTAPPSPDAPEDHLGAAVEALKQGRDIEPSFRLIFEAFEQPLHRFFARRSVPVDERADLVQETFLRVHRNIGAFRGDCQLGTWIFSIAINLHRRHLRGRHEKQLTLDDPAFGLDERLSDPAPNPYETVHDEETQDTLWCLVGQLPPKMRRCLVLRIRHELKIREIATVLGLAPDTVKAHLHGARRRLRQMAEARGFSPDGEKNARLVACSQSRVSSR